MIALHKVVKRLLFASSILELANSIFAKAKIRWAILDSDAMESSKEDSIGK